MRGTWIVALVCGCSFHQGTPGGGGPGGGTDVDAPNIDPTLDTDGDGIPDIADNCPLVANHDQRDFDGDLRGDVCDVCPHIADAGADFDGDGVGDACDPNPTVAGDRIALFDGFYDQSGWTAVSGGATWTIDHHALREPNADGIFQVVHPQNPPPNNVFVETRVHVNGMSQNQSDRHAVGVVVGYQSTQEYYFCGVAATYDGSEIEAGRVDPDYSGNGQYTYTPGTFDASMTGDAIVLQATTAQALGAYTHLDCKGAVAATQGSAGYDTSSDAGGEISLRTNGVDASFDYVFVVEVPPPN
jgi:hypothetical protein